MGTGSPVGMRQVDLVSWEEPQINGYIREELTRAQDCEY